MNEPLKLVPSKQAGDSNGNGHTTVRIDRLEQQLQTVAVAVGKLETRFDTKLEHLATREDMESVKTLINAKETTMLRWLLGILATSMVAIVIALIRISTSGS